MLSGQSAQMNEDALAADERTRKLPVILLAAVIQGWALYALHEAVEQMHWPATAPAWLIALYANAVFAPLTVQMLASLVQRKSMWIACLATAAALFYFGWRYGAVVVDDGAERFIERGEWFPFAVVLTVLWLMVLPFVQCRLANGHWRSRYALLFSVAWRNQITLAEAALFTGLFWLLLFLWQELFGMLGIRFFEEVFKKPLFVYPVTSLAFGVALHLIGSVDRLTSVVLEQGLNVLKWLALLAGLILALFTLALALKLPGMIASGDRAISAAWLLWLVAVTVLLVNAAFRDGSSERPYPRWIAFALRCVIPLTVVSALTAVYALYLRIDAYGFTVERVWACVVAAAACVYSIGYAAAARRSSPWMAGVARVNVVTAWFLIALIALALTPLLSPHRIAAASQFRMAQESEEALMSSRDRYGSPFYYLRFQAGAYGEAKLRELTQLQNHPRADEIRRFAASMIAMKERWDRPHAELDARLANMRVLPAERALDEPLKGRIESDLRGELKYLETETELRYTGAYLALNEQAPEEFVLIFERLAVAYEQTDQGWRRIGVMNVAGRAVKSEAVAVGLATGDVRAEPAKWREVVVNGVRFRLQ